MNLRKIATALWILLAFSCTSSVFATHNLAGQITCKYISTNKYELLLTTYSDPTLGVDRCAATFEIWSSSGLQIAKIVDVPRENGPTDNCTTPNAHKGITVYQAVKENLYRTTYTFPGAGIYTIRYFDPYRRNDIINITDPAGVTFYLETKLFIINPLSGANNSSPVLLNRPLDEACIGKIWTHNPGGYDPDGDSLVYTLLPSQQYDSDNGPFSPTAATGYQFPDASAFGLSSFDINSHTGVITWITPQMIGVYNVAFRVDEYRNGVLLGHLLRDMVIIVKACNNNPPIIETIVDTCVHVNDTLRFVFKAYDPDTTDSVYLALNNANMGNNGPFAVQNAATLSMTNPFGATQLPLGLASDTIKGELKWVTICDNIRKAPYQVDFYAHDNFSYIGTPGFAMLSANQAVSVHVIPPPPTKLTATRGSQLVNLQWEASFCSNTLGYKIYRKIGNSSFAQDTICCSLAPSQAGFQLLKYVEGWTNTSFVDSLTDLPNIFDNAICYVITAMYGKEVQKPNIESCATDPICVIFKSDPIFLTNDSVSVTDSQEGKIWLTWSKPDSIDTFFPSPYHYQLYRGNNNQYPALLLATQVSLDDTTFMDEHLNTTIRGYNYRIEIVDATGHPITMPGNKNISSSIFLSLEADAGVIDLSWSIFAGWNNSNFAIYRKENQGSYALLANINATAATQYHYQDTGLDPNINYCYWIQSTGSHAIMGVKSPLLNASNEVCAYPREANPPCNPLVSVEGNCNEFAHKLFIRKLPATCDDLISFLSLNYGTSFSGPFIPIQTIPYQFANDTTIILNYTNNQTYYAGCYTINATNIYGISSQLSTPFCVDFCPDFALPNTFTPNNDGIHDEFIPMQSRSIVLKEVQIYDRWGVLLHHQIGGNIYPLWNGKMDKTDKESPFGIYYYVIFYEEQRLTGNEAKIAKGWVMLAK